MKDIKIVAILACIGIYIGSFFLEMPIAGLIILIVGIVLVLSEKFLKA